MVIFLAYVKKLLFDGKVCGRLYKSFLVVIGGGFNSYRWLSFFSIDGSCRFR